MASALALFNRSGFFIISNKTVNFGPSASALMHNAYNDWWRSSIDAQENVFYVGKDPRSTDSQALDQYFSFFENSHSKFPLCLAYERTVKSPDKWLQWNPDIRFSETTVMTVRAFVSSKFAQVYASQLEQRRLKWWRRLACSPASFSLTKSANGETHIISSPVTGETNVVETFNRSLEISDSEQHFFNKATNGKSSPELVVSEFNLQSATMAFLEDSVKAPGPISKPKNEATADMALHLHPCLAPYKTAILTGEVITSEMMPIVQHVTQQIRLAGLSCLILPRQPLQEQEKWCDAIGVPYTLKVNEATSKAGTVCIRNRNTHTEERIHLSQAPDLLSKYTHWRPRDGSN